MERHNRRLYRIARAVLRDDSEAEDAVQESYVRAFANLGTFRGDSSLRPGSAALRSTRRWAGCGAGAQRRRSIRWRFCGPCADHPISKCDDG